MNTISKTLRVCALCLASASLLALTLGTQLHAQNTDDLLRYSLLNPSGSPRFAAMGGAFGALGGNFSTLAVNPAGMGIYSHDEIGMSMSSTTMYGHSNYYNETHYDNETKINVPYGGAVFVWNSKDTSGALKRMQFGVGLNRLNDYTGAYLVKGFNAQSSYMEAVAAENQGAVVPDDRQDGTLNAVGGMAYNSYLLNNPDAVGNFSTMLAGGGLNQSKQWYTSGHASEWNFAMSGNLMDKLYFGVGLNIPFIRYHYNSTLSETELNPSYYTYGDDTTRYRFSGYEVSERFSVSGNGISLKLGLMYQPLPYFRVGAWLHTPTLYNLVETYTVQFKSDMELPRDAQGNTLPGATNGETKSEYKYDVTTPLRAGLAFGFIIGKYGVVDMEGEIVNYGGMRLGVGDDRAYEKAVNATVKDRFQVGGTARIGTEWRAGIWRGRLGYVFNSNPFRGRNNSNSWFNQTVSAGMGFAFGRWNLDFSVAHYLQKDDYYLYNLVDAATGKPLVQAANLLQNKFVYNFGFSVKF